MQNGKNLNNLQKIDGCCTIQLCDSSGFPIVVTQLFISIQVLVCVLSKQGDQSAHSHEEVHSVLDTHAPLIQPTGQVKRISLTALLLQYVSIKSGPVWAFSPLFKQESENSPRLL